MAQVWRVKKNVELRLREGHPWVYSHEIVSKTKNFRQHELVELQNEEGKFLARGYGNPRSKIIFRAVTFLASEKEPLSFDSIKKKLIEAWSKRFQLGFKNSFRLCHSEGDGLPGLIVDRFLLETHQVFSLQISTDGMQRALPDILSLLQKVCEESLVKNWSSISWEKTTLVLRNDISVRAREGLQVEHPRFIKIVNGTEPSQSWILVESADGMNTIRMNCDLYQGQKTGFFLDQLSNIKIVSDVLSAVLKTEKTSTYKILDLCCYVGHWSVQLGAFLKKKSIFPEVTLVDLSLEALTRAQKNLEEAQLSFQVLRKDVLKISEVLPERFYDLVIADPPAFVKSKKDLGAGKQAYQKLNFQALRSLKKNGILVSCSCSGAMKKEDLLFAVEKAAEKSGRSLKCLGAGKLSPDHPQIPGFPEGGYLKMWIHQVLD